MSAPEMGKEIKLKFVLPPEVADGVYASVAQVRVTRHDCVITFLQPVMPVVEPMPNSIEARAVARVLVAKSFIRPLIDALQTAQANIDADEGAAE